MSRCLSASLRYRVDWRMVIPLMLLDALLMANLRNELSLQPLGHSPRHSSNPWIVYHAPHTKKMVPLREMLSGRCGVKETILILVQLASDYC